VQGQGRVGRSRRLLAGALALMLVPCAQAQPVGDLLDLSLEELGNLRVTSVSRRAQRVAQAPASVFVITAEDLRRAGVTSLPEALRLAPNLQIARISAHAYAISARGFNNATGNKLQVLMDGRVLYSPLFSGVFWDTQDTPIADIDRIEVISGPAATLWGANAVNGVINIVTRRSVDTQGGLVHAWGGSNERGGTVRFGGLAGEAAFRVHARHFDRDASLAPDRRRANDAIWRSQAGFRADWGGPASGLSLHGNVYRGAFETDFPQHSRISGGHLVGLWTQLGAAGDERQLRLYYDRTRRELANSVTDRLDTFDIEFQHGYAGFERHSLVWGGGYRQLDDRVENAAALAFVPPDRLLRNSWLFVQDEYQLAARWRLIGGLRMSRNSYTGIEVLPSLRAAFEPDEQKLLWAAVSRAVRAPSRLDRELFAPSEPPFLLVGNDSFESEVALVTELGWRAQPSTRSSWSVTVFQHDYERLRSFETTAAGPLVIGNRLAAEVRGLEAWGVRQFAPGWRLSAGLLLLDVDFRVAADSTDTLPSRLGNDPSRQWMLRSSHELSERVQFDAIVRHVGALPEPAVPAYTTLDLRLGWRLGDRLELALVGRDLCAPRHVEFGPMATASRIERSAYLDLRWTF
jgi:iron complex outermembrane recepter protein